MTPITPQTSKAWYHEPYMWLVVLFPLTSVIVGMNLLRLSISSYDGLVADDYYKRGLEINQTLERDKAAISHNLAAQLQFAEGNVQVVLSSRSGYPLPEQLALNLYHNTRNGFDQTLTLEPLGNGVYRGRYESLAAGGWGVQIAAGDWRLQGELSVPGPLSLQLRASPAAESAP